jgi:hypothetical protein
MYTTTKTLLNLFSAYNIKYTHVNKGAKMQHITLPPAQPKRILFSCFMYPDGKGDIGHFIDIAKPVNYVNQNMPAALYCVICIRRDFEWVVESMLSSGILTEIKAAPANLTLETYKKTNFDKYFEELLKLNPNALIIPLEFNDYPQRPYPKDPLYTGANEVILREKSQKVIDQWVMKTGFDQRLKEVCLSVNVSTPFIFRLGNQLEMPKYPRMFIGEHNSLDAEIDNILNRIMGFRRHQHGLLLTAPKARTLEEKTAVLKNLKNQKFLNDLLSRDIKSEKDQKTNLGTIADDFLSKNLFVPGHIQNTLAMGNFINSIIGSKLTKQYANVVFYVNKNLIDDTTFNKQKLIDNGFTELEINVDGTIQSIHLSDNTPQRKLRILMGYDLDNNDYTSLYQIAQLFAGCSGDKTLELVISNLLIPFYESRPWKDKFSKSFRSAAASYTSNKSVLDFIHLFLYYERGKIAESITKMMDSDPSFLSEWKKVLDGFHKDYNFYSNLIKFLKQGIVYSELNQSLSSKADAKSTDIKSLFNQLGMYTENNAIVKLLIGATAEYNFVLSGYFYNIISGFMANLNTEEPAPLIILKSYEWDRVNKEVISNILTVCRQRSKSMGDFLITYHAIPNNKDFFIELKNYLIYAINEINDARATDITDASSEATTEIIDSNEISNLLQSDNIDKIVRICDILLLPYNELRSEKYTESLNQQRMKYFEEMRATPVAEQKTTVSPFFKPKATDNVERTDTKLTLPVAPKNSAS